MIQIKSTGKNSNYGKKGETILVGDYHFIPAIKNGWVECKGVKYIDKKSVLNPKLNNVEEARRLKKRIEDLNKRIKFLEGKKWKHL